MSNANDFQDCLGADLHVGDIVIFSTTHHREIRGWRGRTYLSPSEHNIPCIGKINKLYYAKIGNIPKCRITIIKNTSRHLSEYDIKPKKIRYTYQVCRVDNLAVKYDSLLDGNSLENNS